MLWRSFWCSFGHYFKGLENSWERHREVAEYFHAGLESMGLKLFVKEKVSNSNINTEPFLLSWNLKVKSLNSDYNGWLLQRARLPTVTTIIAPPGYDWKEITAYLMKTHNLEISGGLGPSAGLVREKNTFCGECCQPAQFKSLLIILPFVFLSLQVLRVGLMGCNSSKANVDMVLAALKDALKNCHKSKV